MLAAAVRPARTRLTSHPCPCDPERRNPAQSEPVPRAHRAVRHPLRTSEPDTTAQNRRSTTGN